jgi:translation initiation factor IF-3
MANNHFYRGRPNNKFRPKEQKNYIRVNFNIKVPNVRVVQEDGTQLGIMATDAARKLATEQGVDLVEIVPNANPPVCKLTNFDKFRYEQKQKEKEAKKVQKEKMIETKEVRFRPCTQPNDIEVKGNAIIRFLGEGKKVSLNLEYKRRELSHRDEGYKIINSVLGHVKEHAIVEFGPKMEGNRLVCRLAPKKPGENNAVSASGT